MKQTLPGGALGLGSRPARHPGLQLRLLWQGTSSASDGGECARHGAEARVLRHRLHHAARCTDAAPSSGRLFDDARPALHRKGLNVLFLLTGLCFSATTLQLVAPDRIGSDTRLVLYNQGPLRAVVRSLHVRNFCSTLFSAMMTLTWMMLMNIKKKYKIKNSK